MKLYSYDSAPNPARLKMFLDYKDIHIETQQIDLATSENTSEEYLAIVPEGAVPALILEDGTRLTEVIAIAHYLELLYPERPLLGVTPKEKALVLNWSHHVFIALFMAGADAFRNAHPAYKDRALPGPVPVEQIPALVERGRTRLRLGFDRLNTELGSRDFVACDHVSFADIDLLALITFAKWGAKVEVKPELTHLLAWRERALSALQG